ncbi:MAG: CBS domain-containing protein [Pseudomonadota bacterium]
MMSDDLTVITTHVNADFDAFASLLAAQKLYPDSVVVFPGSQERNIREFFLDSTTYLFNWTKFKDLDFDSVKRIVLVDTRQRGRIGRFAEVVDRQGVDVHIYDHHPSMPDDIVGSVEVLEPVGATVTILCRILEAREILIRPEEATILALGLYEDTGSFTFTSTTEEDFRVAAYLVSKGANLRVVSNIITRELSPWQITVLNELIQVAMHHVIHGVDIVLASVSFEHYISDLSALVHKFANMEDFSAVFVLARMVDRIYLVARSKLPDVDVAGVAAEFGGGGHAYAASATIRNLTLNQAEERLIEILHSQIRPRWTARSLASSPAIFVHSDVIMEEANATLTRYNINVLLVMEGEKLLGAISRQVVERALHHGLKDVPVTEYMTTDLATIGAEGTLSAIQEKIVENKQRLLPVVEDGKVVGVITRTDLLNAIVSNSEWGEVPAYESFEKVKRTQKRNVRNLLQQRLPSRVFELLLSMGEAADRLNYCAYAVGGFVRDVLISKENLDIDIVIEGDGIRFAKEFVNVHGGRMRSHEKFGTAVMILPEGIKVDVATARLEYYESPGSMPKVETSSIKLDLYRRDFTINTLAVCLNKEKLGALIDFFKGQKDLKDKSIRVLHNLSFVEDPTRIFRAIRFEQRFGFKIGKHTSNLMHNSVKMGFLSRLSGKRLFAEIKLILEETNPLHAVERMNEYGLFECMQPQVVINRKTKQLFTEIAGVLSWYDLLFLGESYMKWAVYLMGMTYSLSEKEADEFCCYLDITDRHHALFVNEKTRGEWFISWFKHHFNASNSTVYAALKPLSLETLLYIMARAENERTQKAISLYITKLRGVKIFLRGNDLQKLDIKPGPVYREIMEEVLNARLNGLVETRHDEIEFAREMLYEKKTYFERDAINR